MCPKAIKNPRENTRSPRTGHEMKRSYDMMEGSMGRSHPGREGAPFEGTACVSLSLQHVFCFFPSVSGGWQGLFVSQVWLAEPCPEKESMVILRKDHWWLDPSCKVVNCTACHISISCSLLLAEQGEKSEILWNHSQEHLELLQKRMKMPWNMAKSSERAHRSGRSKGVLVKASPMRGWTPSKNWDGLFTKSPGKNCLARTSARPLTCQTGGLWMDPYLR